MVEERYPTKEENNSKRIYFKGMDGMDYCIEFYHLTNGTDIEIAQYQKPSTGEWEQIKLEPEKCLEKKNRE
jgi:hypothetical protein